MLKISAMIAAATLAVAAVPTVTFAQMNNGVMSGRSMSKGSTGGALHGMAYRMKMKKSHHGSMHHGSMHHGMMKKSMRSGM